MKEPFELENVYSEYLEQKKGVEYYDKLQFSLRKFSLTLLLGTFGAIFFVFSINRDILNFNPALIAGTLCLLSIMVSYSIAAYDLIFTERLLLSNYLEALRLETTHKWIFPIHSHMMNLEKRRHHGAASQKAKFYIGFNIDILILLSLIIIYELGFSRWYYSVFVVLPSTLFFVWFLKFTFQKMALSSEKKFYEILKEQEQMENGK